MKHDGKIHQHNLNVAKIKMQRQKVKEMKKHIARK
jgi:hypothetical protein